MPSTHKALDEAPIGESAPILDIVDETFIRARRPDVAMAVPKGLDLDLNLGGRTSDCEGVRTPSPP